jgi:hypothetical protein
MIGKKFKCPRATPSLFSNGLNDLTGLNDLNAALT